MLKSHYLKQLMDPTSMAAERVFKLGAPVDQQTPLKSWGSPMLEHPWGSGMLADTLGCVTGNLCIFCVPVR